MQDLSLHLLDIAGNSIRAHASMVKILIDEAVDLDLLCMQIEDNGDGMTSDFVAKVTDPFVTTRTTRKVGLGLPLLAQNCELSGGHLNIESKKGYGTCIKATMSYGHIDRLPLGDFASTLCVLIQSNPQIDFIYTHCYGKNKFILDTREIKKILQDVPINNLEIVHWLKEYIEEGIENVRKVLN